MAFNSLHFLIFLPTVTLVFFAFKAQKHRRVLLLAASYYFYAVWSLPFASLLLASTAANYFAARAIGGSTDGVLRKRALVAAVIVNLGFLFFFKYADFAGASILVVAGFRPWPELNLVLPLGISFYTFQAMAYTIDVYRGTARPTSSFLDVALYVSFFPQLVAGPIMRAQDLMGQFVERRPIDRERMMGGALLVTWGLGKKAYLADPLGRLVNDVYGSSGSQSGWALLLGTYAFALQIYFDFSAYTDIARGAGRILGFELAENFRAPYLAVSLRDFWHRWHISLSTWLRDYLYIPLGGNRKGRARSYLALAVTMLLGGLWHGAAWTFIVWGALHGAFLVVERITGIARLDHRKMGPLERFVRTAITLHLVCLAWVFFRANNFEQALDVLWRIGTWAPGRDASWSPAVIMAGLVFCQYCLDRFRAPIVKTIVARPALARWAVYCATALLAIAIGGSQSPEFIYFQF